MARDPLDYLIDVSCALAVQSLFDVFKLSDHSLRRNDRRSLRPNKRMDYSVDSVHVIVRHAAECRAIVINVLCRSKDLICILAADQRRIGSRPVLQLAIVNRAVRILERGIGVLHGRAERVALGLKLVALLKIVLSALRLQLQKLVVLASVRQALKSASSLNRLP